MRFGFIGPAGTDASLLEKGVDLLIDRLEADAVLYFAADESIRDFITAHQGSKSDLSFEQQVAQVAATGSPEEINHVVRSLCGARYLEKLRVVPQAPGNVIEMIDDRILCMVRDKSSLGEEDVINSNVVIYGDAIELSFKRYGPRCFFSPGPLGGGHVGTLDDEAESGGVTLRAIDLDGEVLWAETIQGRGTKMKVAP